MPALTAAPEYKMVRIDADRKIRYTFSSACRFEESYGKSIPQALQHEVGARVIAHLAWAGMIHDEPTLSVKKAESRIQKFLSAGGDMSVLSEALLEALMDSGVLGRRIEDPPDESPDPNEPTQD